MMDMTATPALMPRTSAPVRTVTRIVADDQQDRWCGDFTCEVCGHPSEYDGSVVEVVRVIRTPKRNPAMADAVRAAGLRL